MNINIKNMKMKLKKIFAVLCVFALMLSIAGIQVYAADLTLKGTLTVVTEYDGNKLPDMNIEIFLISTAGEAGGEIVYTPTPAFAAALAGEILDPNKMSGKENLDLAAKLSTAASATSNVARKLTSSDEDKKGKAEFVGLTAGVYLVTQRASSSIATNNGVYTMQSFIVAVPYTDANGLFFEVTSVVANPKIEPKKGTLRLTKTVTGSSTINDEFWFEIKFTAPQGVFLNGVTQVTTQGTAQSIVNLASGSGTTAITINRSLGAGQTIEFRNIPFGTYYEIKEIRMPEDFELVGITDGGNGTVDGDTATGTVKNAAIINIVVNNKNTTTTTESTPTTTPGPTPTTTPEPTPTTTPEPTPTTTPEPTPTTTPEPTPTTTPGPTPTTTPEPTPTTTPEPTTQPEPSTEPTIESTTEPTTEDEEYYEDDNRVPLVNFPDGWYGIYDEEEDVWYVYDENNVPQGVIKFPDDFPEDMIPLVNFTTEPVIPKPNPTTGDTYIGLAVLFGLLLISGGVVIVLIRKKKAKETT